LQGSRTVNGSGSLDIANEVGKVIVNGDAVQLVVGRAATLTDPNGRAIGWACLHKDNISTSNGSIVNPVNGKGTSKRSPHIQVVLLVAGN